MKRLLDIATGVTLGRLNHKQNFYLAAAGLRKDGVIVVSFNGIRQTPMWEHHAEARLCRKLTPHSVVAVVRILTDGTWAMARPCASCQRCMRRVGVKRVYYSIAPNEVMDFYAISADEVLGYTVDELLDLLYGFIHRVCDDIASTARPYRRHTC